MSKTTTNRLKVIRFPQSLQFQETWAFSSFCFFARIKAQSLEVLWKIISFYVIFFLCSMCETQKEKIKSFITFRLLLMLLCFTVLNNGNVYSFWAIEIWIWARNGFSVHKFDYIKCAYVERRPSNSFNIRNLSLELFVCFFVSFI